MPMAAATSSANTATTTSIATKLVTVLFTEAERHGRRRDRAVGRDRRDGPVLAQVGQGDGPDDPVVGDGEHLLDLLVGEPGVAGAALVRVAGVAGGDARRRPCRRAGAGSRCPGRWTGRPSGAALLDRRGGAERVGRRPEPAAGDRPPAGAGKWMSAARSCAAESFSSSWSTRELRSASVVTVPMAAATTATSATTVTTSRRRSVHRGREPTAIRRTASARTPRRAACAASGCGPCRSCGAGRTRRARRCWPGRRSRTARRGRGSAPWTAPAWGCA